jgi:hypothetical protein
MKIEAEPLSLRGRAPIIRMTKMTDRTGLAPIMDLRDRNDPNDHEVHLIEVQETRIKAEPLSLRGLARTIRMTKMTDRIGLAPI